ncbi:hypothetical protein ACIO6U_07300 [Streptomyces sp. NPDC087422]|uniref:hypothetical protein n=1 Tax=Streptomyces sp. NPDC087422 TaxID=3365786 RepID=UPI003805853E
MTERVTIHDVARALPSIAGLRDVCRALAALEIVRYPGAGEIQGDGRGERERDFVRGWRTAADVGVWRTGSGDGYAVAFTCYGALVLGFDHASPMSPYASGPPPRNWPGVLDAVPPVFAPYVAEPPEFLAAEVPLVTACAWRTADDDRWRTGDGIVFPAAESGVRGRPDGAAWLFAPLTDPDPEAYARESGLAAEAVRGVYALRPLDRETVAALNPAAPFEAVAGELERIGYPVAR